MLEQKLLDTSPDLNLIKEDSSSSKEIAEWIIEQIIEKII